MGKEGGRPEGTMAERGFGVGREGKVAGRRAQVKELGLK